MKNAILFLAVIIGMSSCKIIQSLAQMQKKKAKVSTMKLGDKTVKFIPMHHLGKQQFYDDVKSKVTDYQKDGYRVYYEMIHYVKKADSLQNDLFFRKVRKLRGSGGNYKQDMDEAGVFKSYVFQPSYTNLGVDSSSSIRADVDWDAIVAEYEKQYGTIQLDSNDIHTPLSDKKYTSTVLMDRHKLNRIMVNFRNAHLASVIKNSPDKKILVVYGKGHEKGAKKLLMSHKVD